MSGLTWLRGSTLASDLAWLESVTEGSSATGYEPRRDAFEDHVWVLHQMAERKTGSRVLWRDLWSRHGLTLGEGMRHPPGSDWFIGPRPAFGLRHPLGHGHYGAAEGTLDDETFRALARCLPGGDTELVAVWDWLPIGTLRDSPMDFDHLVEQTPLGAHASVETLIAEAGNTPSNLWPADRSWLLWTDYDLWATDVHGSATVIAAIEADPELETLRWTVPPADG
jgi:hypothetical protein